ncbi:MAG: hypothetical protein U9N42_06565 [Campylobacterota bacterium]|nr:hypothetical protein [Campylobacterota bacterium]
MVTLTSLNHLLEHIKVVQEDVLNMSSSSSQLVEQFLEDSGVELDDNIVKAMQLQDITTQQLNGVIETLTAISEKLSNKDTVVFDDIIASELIEAKNKKDRFSGKSVSQELDLDEIEFF